MIPKGVIRDIVTSYLPHWDIPAACVLVHSPTAVRLCRNVLALSDQTWRRAGEVNRRADAGAEGALFVVGGELTLRLAGTARAAARWLCLPPGAPGACKTAAPVRCISLDPEAVSAYCLGSRWCRCHRPPTKNAVAPTPMPGTDGGVGDGPFRRSNRYQARQPHDDRDFRTRSVITFAGDNHDGARPLCSGRQAVYRLNQGIGLVEAGDYMKSAPFCPQACYASGPGTLRYLLQ